MYVQHPRRVRPGHMLAVDPIPIDWIAIFLNQKYIISIRRKGTWPGSILEIFVSVCRRISQIFAIKNLEFMMNPHLHLLLRINFASKLLSSYTQ